MSSRPYSSPVEGDSSQIRSASLSSGFAINPPVISGASTATLGSFQFGDVNVRQAPDEQPLDHVVEALDGLRDDLPVESVVLLLEVVVVQQIGVGTDQSVPEHERAEGFPKAELA